MRLGRIFILVALLLIVVVAGLFLFAQGFGGGGGEPAADQVSLIQIVMVEQFIPRGGTITADALGFISFPADQVFPELMFTDPSEVEGTRARYDLLPGTPLISTQVVGIGEGLTDTGSDTALDIQPGMVAISIPIDRFSSVGYGLKRGDHVNVIVTMLFVDLDTDFQTILPNATAGVLSPGNAIMFTVEGGDSVSSNLTTNEDLTNLTAQSVTGGSVSPRGRTEFDTVLNQPFYVVPREAQRPRLVSQTLLQDVIVIHVGDFPLGNEEEETTTPSTGTGAPPQPGDQSAQAQAAGEPAAQEVEPPDIITLMVFPQDAVTLNYLVLMGAHLNLVMRASGDDSRVFTQAVTLDWLLAQHNIPVPTRLPYGFEPALYRIISPAALDLLDVILAGNENQ